MKYIFCENISWQIYDDFVYIVNEITRQKIVLNNTAKEIWCGISSGLSLEENENKLLKKYDVKQEIIHRDINKIYSDLVKRNILKEVC